MFAIHHINNIQFKNIDNNIFDYKLNNDMQCQCKLYI